MDGKEEKPEKFLGKFIFTRKTVTFGRKTLQISNVSKIKMKSFRETTRAKHNITLQRKNQAIIGILLALLMLAGGGALEMLLTLGIMLLLICAAIIWYYYDECDRKKDSTRNYHGLFFDCTSGKTEVLWSDKQEFVARLFDRISNSMNDNQMSSFVANFTDNSISVSNSKNVVIATSIEAGQVGVGDNASAASTFP